MLSSPGQALATISPTMKILVAGYQHETNTFAPTLADWAAFNRGDTFPAYVHGQTMLDQLH